MGDLNRAIGSDEWAVAGNHGRVSYGGQLVRVMIKERNCVILNNMATGGGLGHGCKEGENPLKV